MKGVKRSCGKSPFSREKRVHTHAWTGRRVVVETDCTYVCFHGYVRTVRVGKRDQPPFGRTYQWATSSYAIESPFQ